MRFLYVYKVNPMYEYVRIYDYQRTYGGESAVAVGADMSISRA